MAKLTGKALVAQGGGPTAVINQSLVGVVLEARKYAEITKMYGSRHGVSGILNEDFVDLTEATTQNLEQVAITPGSALGSTRDKPDTAYCHKMFEVMEKHDIRYFFYIGGNDSVNVCHIVNEEAKKVSYELRVFHIPKTIDNDLVGIDHTLGYGSAAKFVAQAFAGINQDNRSLPGVYIGSVMGRHAGFLTAASILGKKYDDDGPHLIYVPEKGFSTSKFLIDVTEVYNKYGRCVVAVSEGIHDGDGTPIVVKLQKKCETDQHGNVQLSGTGALADLLADLIKTKTNIKRVRADTLGYVQRSFLGCVSPVDARESREAGEKAVEFSMRGDVDGTVVLKRVGDYAVEYALAPLATSAKQVKCMPADFIKGDNYITKKFIDYARPLVGELPQVTKLEAPEVKKVK